MDIIRLPPEERVLHAVCLVHCPLLTEASSLLRCLAVPGPSWSISVSNRITSALVYSFFHLDVMSSRVQSMTTIRSC